jgi:HK97 family phage major capsid protein
MATKKPKTPQGSDSPEAPAPERFYREAALSLVPNGDTGEMEIAISSEHGVERMDFFTGERFIEVLDHTSGAVDMSRALDGLPILLDHDPKQQVGILEGARVDSDRVIRGVPKYSRSQRGREVQMDVEDGIRKKVSAGYVVKQWDKKPSATRGGLPTWRAVNWMPVEMSHVAIPADLTVGVGRSAEVAAPAVHIHQTARKAEERSVSDENTAANGQAVTHENKNGLSGLAEWVETADQRANREAVEVAKRNGDEMKEVAELAEMHALEGVLIAGTKAGKRADDIRADMVKAMRARLASQQAVNSPIVEMTQKEKKEYSFSRAVLAAADNGDCFEADVSQQIASNIQRYGIPNAKRVDGNGHAFYFPTNTRAGLYNAATVGSEVVFDAPGEFISLLRNKARVLQLGATYLGGLREPLTFPEQNGAGTASWMAENGGADVSDTNITLTTKTLTPKTLMSSSSVSRQLLRQAQTNFDVEQLIRSDLATIHALAIDLAAIAGTGASNQPTGLFSNTSVQVYSFATNGGTPTYTNMVGHIFAVENSNANVSTTGFLTTPGIKATLMVSQKFASTNGEPVWIGGEEGTVAGIKAYSSNQVQKTLTAGTSTTVAHAIYYGCWDQLYIGEWGAMEVIVDPYRLKKQGMIELTSFQMVGIMVRRPTSFVISKQSLSAF